MVKLRITIVFLPLILGSVGLYLDFEASSHEYTNIGFIAVPYSAYIFYELTKLVSKKADIAGYGVVYRYMLPACISLLAMLAAFTLLKVSLPASYTYIVGSKNAEIVQITNVPEHATRRHGYLISTTGGNIHCSWKPKLGSKALLHYKESKLGKLFLGLDPQ